MSFILQTNGVQNGKKPGTYTTFHDAIPLYSVQIRQKILAFVK